jgi:hypothetical protein
LLPLNALTYLPFEVLRPFGITLTLVLLSLVLPRERPQRRADDYYPFFALTALGASWLARANNGGALNTLLPVCAALALMLGLAFDRLLAATKALPEGRQAAASGVLYLLALAQLLALAYNPFAQLPSQQQRQSSDALLAVLSQIDGDVFIPSKAYLSTMTGKAPTAATVNLFELNGHFTTAGLDEQRATPIAQAIAAALASRRYALLVVDNVDASLFGPELDAYYQPVRFPQLEGHNAYFSVHTWMANTELKFYVPR